MAESRFLEAPFVRQADGELKKYFCVQQFSSLNLLGPELVWNPIFGHWFGSSKISKNFLKSKGILGDAQISRNSSFLVSYCSKNCFYDWF